MQAGRGVARRGEARQANQEDKELDSTVKDGVQKVVRALISEHNKVTASMLVDAARPEDSPAHGGFEWDDAKAAEEYRINQGRRWIRVCTVEYEGEESRLVNVPRVRLDSDPEGSTGEGDYKPVAAIVHVPDEFERALSLAVAKLHAARRAVDELRGAADRAPSEDRTAMIAQISRGLEILETALKTTH